ncbi:SusC/RagA family TonB-linked outer membrane protein [Butyricimonas synergistica]|uniref:SusC/RagA family TonB-linked outer membrane protein n=1 Tax=Butyricimonas synergistica TaxID=544644 RepID=UPI00036FF590|nr:SusC/RagA family TonB-linked outer membrane protein [Butyricimonas synergistica]
MRWTWVWVIVLVFGVLGKGTAQTVKMTDSVQTLRMVFDEVEQQTGMLTLFSNNELDMHREVKLESREYTLKELYEYLLKGTGLEFEILNHYVVIRPVRRKNEDGKMLEIKGKVSDERGEPLPGVSIVVKGSSRGVITDANGEYRILLPKVKSVILLFSFIGKRMKQVMYLGKGDLNIVMEDENQEVEEVVITGFQNVSKRHLTSAVTSMKASEIMLPGVTTIDRMLEGQVPGMIFMQNSGQIGVAPRLRIRGSSTILGTQEPLWVIDGIVQNDPVNVDAGQINDLDFVNLLGNAISGLNPNDVERIDVLKDASATALYGVRAANGVIVITTKKGQEGPLKVNYNFTGSLTTRSRYTDASVDVMDALERIDYSREIIEKGIVLSNISSWVGYEGALMEFYRGEISFTEFQEKVGYYEKNNTDWFDVICRDAFSHNHNLSLSGGTSLIKYYVSLGYNRENGVLKKEHGDRYTTSVCLSGSYKRFGFSFGMTGNVQKRHYTPLEVGLLNYAYNTSRAVPVYNENGSLWYYPRQGTTYMVNYNVLNERDHSGQIVEGKGISLNMSLDYRLTNTLKAETVLAYHWNNTDQDIYFGEQTAYAADLRGDLYDGGQVRGVLPFGGELRKDDTKSYSYTLRGQLNYSPYLDKAGNHSFSVVIGGEVVSSKYTGRKQIYRGGLSGDGKLIEPVDVEEYPAFGKWSSETPEVQGIAKHQVTNMASLYGSLTYSIRNIYIFNMNARIDASNKFGKDANKRLLPIWSVSGRWNMKDGVLRNLKWVDDFSLRLSFGYQGNMLELETSEMVIEKGEWDDRMESDKSYIYKFPNPNLAWERTSSLNLGTDFSFFEGRLRGTVSYFYKKTRDAFLKKKISVINGVREYVVNQGTIENQGVELGLSCYLVASKGKGTFSWRVDPQLSKVLNRLVNEDKGRDQVMHNSYGYQDYIDGNVQIVGRPLNSFFSYEFTGLSSKDGRPTFANIGEENWEKYAEMTHEDVFQTVMSFSGCRMPYIQGGIGNTFTYRNLALSCNFTYSVGSKVRLLKLYNNIKSVVPQPAENLRREMLNRWKRPGDEKYTNIPGILPNAEFSETVNAPWWRNELFKFAENIWQMYNDSDIRVVSGNYLKLQQVSLRYALPERWCKAMQMDSLQLSFTTLHLATWCHRALKGQDPGTQTGTSSNINVPVRPSYTFSLNATF